MTTGREESVVLLVDLSALRSLKVTIFARYTDCQLLYSKIIYAKQK